MAELSLTTVSFRHVAGFTLSHTGMGAKSGGSDPNYAVVTVNPGGTAHVSKCSFVANSLQFGAVMVAKLVCNSSPCVPKVAGVPAYDTEKYGVVGKAFISSTVFAGNEALASAGVGGAITNYGNVSLVASKFSGNKATNWCGTVQQT